MVSSILRRTAATGLALAVSLSAGLAAACEAEEMATTDNGFILKIVAGSDKIVGFETQEAKTEKLTMDLLQPYFVICDAGEMYKITDLPANTVDEALTGNVAFVRKDQVFTWPTREALTFNALIFDDTRPEVVAWEDEDILDQYMSTGDVRKFPPAFKEDLDSTLKRERATRPYPVLGSDTRKLRDRVDKRVYRTLIPAALPPDAAIVAKNADGEAADIKEIEKVLKSASFVVVFDATGSMEPVARNVAKDLIAAFDTLDEETKKNSRVGFVFFRDEDDSEKIAVSKLLPIEDGSKLLIEAASRMTGGGDIPEPILDATVVAADYFEWDAQGAARKIVIGVLNGDAKPTTTGKIDDRVAAGMDAATIAGRLREEGVTMITMQASPDAGEYLVPVLSTLAEGTKGQFLAHGGGSVSEALAAAMKEKVVVEEKAGGEIAKRIFDYNGYPAIPLEVLDGERLDRLRRAGIEFNIEAGSDGVLVRPAYIIENPDLLDPQIQIEKETLTTLINLFSVLGTVGADAEGMQEAVGEAVAAIAGEDFDRSEPLDSIVKKTLGIQFRSGILSFDMEFLSVLTPKERLKFTQRIQKGGEKLGQFLEANLAEFDSQPAVWMPISELP